LILDMGRWVEPSVGMLKWRYLVGVKNVVRMTDSCPLAVSDIFETVADLTSSQLSRSPTTIGSGNLAQPLLDDAATEAMGFQWDHGGFKLTPVSTMCFSLVSTMRSWKVGPEPGALLVSLRECLEQLNQRNDLDEMTKAFSGCQCGFCLSLSNDLETAQCPVCGNNAFGFAEDSDGSEFVGAEVDEGRPQSSTASLIQRGSDHGTADVGSTLSRWSSWSRNSAIGRSAPTSSSCR
jgi:hypothetical protein